MIQIADSAQQRYIVNRLRDVDMLWQEIDLACSQFFVALAEGNVCGFVGLEFDGAFALLRSLYVEPAFRTQGIASRLMAYAETAARVHGVKAIFCFSTEAGGYFLKHGYAQTPVALLAQRVRNAPQMRYYLERGAVLAEEISYAKWFVPRPTDGIVIRSATLDDVAPITAIYSESVAHGTASWEYDPPNLNDLRTRMQTVLSGGFPYLVAEVDGAVLSYSYASTYRPRIGYRFVCEDSVYVDKSLRGRGIGKMILSTLIERCAQQGLKQMVGVIGDSENQASINLHKSLGFTQVGLLPEIGYKFDRWLDSVMMQRAL